MHRGLAIATGSLALALLPGCSAPTATDPTSNSHATVLAHVPSTFEIDGPRLSAGFAAAEAQRRAVTAQQGAQDAFVAEAARAESARAEAAAAAAAAEAEAAAEVADEGCIGYGCSPEQDAELNEAESAANDDYGPGCDYQLCGDPGSGFPPFACDAGPDGLPVCEGEVPASVGPYYTPDGTLVGG
jgi:hypothetical protein